MHFANKMAWIYLLQGLAQYFALPCIVSCCQFGVLCHVLFPPKSPIYWVLWTWQTLGTHYGFLSDLLCTLPTEFVFLRSPSMIGFIIRTFYIELWCSSLSPCFTVNYTKQVSMAVTRPTLFLKVPGLKLQEYCLRACRKSFGRSCRKDTLYSRHVTLRTFWLLVLSISQFLCTLKLLFHIVPVSFE